jgi:hypothetical protein
MPLSDFLTIAAADAAAVGWPVGNLPPFLTHSSTEAKAVNFLVFPYEGEPFSWQMPASDFFTAGSAAYNILLASNREDAKSQSLVFNMDNFLTN